MKTCSHKKLHANIHVSIIHNILKSGEKKTNIYQLVSKLCYFCKMKFNSIIKRNIILIHSTTWIKVKKNAKSKRPDTQDYILYGFI